MQKPQAWTGSQTAPFEIIPALGRSCVCGHSPRDRLTALTEFRWALHWKSLRLPRLSLQREKANWLLSLPPPRIFRAAAIFCQRWQGGIFQRNRWPVSPARMRAFRGYSVSTEAGNAECIVWFFSATSLRTPARPIKHTDLFSGVIKYSWALNVLRDAYRIHAAPLWRIIKLALEPWQMLDFTCFDLSLNPISPPLYPPSTS